LVAAGVPELGDDHEILSDVSVRFGTETTSALLIRDGEVQLDPQLGGRDRNVVFLEFATRLDLDVWGLR
jgi:hypothetical protein